MSTGSIRVAVFLSTASLACSQIVGADFDGLRERPAEQGGSQNGGGQSGGASGTFNSGGTGAGMVPSGGASSGGGPANGGSPSTGGGGVVAGAGGAFGSGGSTGAAGTVSGGTAGLGGGVGGSANGGSGGSGGGAPGPVVVLNEVKGQGAGDDFIELYNRGPGLMTLDGYKVSDGGNFFTFPPNTMLAEGAYLLVLLGQPTAGGGFTCFTSNPCFHDTWGIAQTGESALFEDPSYRILDSTTYPGTLVDGQTWGRYPNGTGMFQPTSPTPEAANLL